MRSEPGRTASDDGASILRFPTTTPVAASDIASPANGGDHIEDDGDREGGDHSEGDGDQHGELRSVLGDVLRTERLDQDRTLAEVAGDAHVSLAYLSEVERGIKDVSSELLGAVIDSLDIPLATVLQRCIDRLPVTGAQRGVDARLLAA